MMDDNGCAVRKQVQVDGVPVGDKLIQSLLLELRVWTDETDETIDPSLPTT